MLTKFDKALHAKVVEPYVLRKNGCSLLHLYKVKSQVRYIKVKKCNGLKVFKYTYNCTHTKTHRA